MGNWPQHEEDERDAVAEVLASGLTNYWNGRQGKLFEKEFATYCNVPHAVAVANGTVALELALHSLGIGEGDEVVVTPRTFIASASSIVMRGARPVFADVDPVSQNINAKTIEAVLSSRTRAIVAVHLAGWPCEMDTLQAMAEAYRLAIIEDCAQALGASYRGQKVGGFGDAAGFSFCADKIISTGGEGGMLTVREEAVWRRAWAYKDHGKNWDEAHKANPSSSFRWLHESFGTNLRLTEVQSAIGRIQLQKVERWLSRRKDNAARINGACQKYSALRITEPPAHVKHAYYKLYCFVRPDKLRLGWTRDRIVKEIQAHGITCLQGSCSEVYRERAFESTEFRPDDRLPVARELGETSLLFLVDHTLTDEYIDRTCRTIDLVMSEASI